MREFTGISRNKEKGQILGAMEKTRHWVPESGPQENKLVKETTVLSLVCLPKVLEEGNAHDV